MSKKSSYKMDMLKRKINEHISCMTEKATFKYELLERYLDCCYNMGTVVLLEYALEHKQQVLKPAEERCLPMLFDVILKEIIETANYICTSAVECANGMHEVLDKDYLKFIGDGLDLAHRIDNTLKGLYLTE